MAESDFGAPKEIASFPDVDTGVVGAVYENYASNDIYIAWPTEGPNDSAVMDLWVSTNHGASYSAPMPVATINGFIQGQPSLAALGEQSGFLTFSDTAGLHLVDLWPISRSASSPGHHAK